MAAETRFESFAVTPGTPVLRDFQFIGQSYPFPLRTKLSIDNGSGNTLIVTLNGRQPAYRCRPNRLTEISGRIYFYQVDATGAINAGDVTVYENGGLDERESPPAANPDVPTEVQ